MPQVKTTLKKNNNNLEFALNENFNIILVVLVLVILTIAYFLLIKPKFDSTLIIIKDIIFC